MKKFNRNFPKLYGAMAEVGMTVEELAQRMDRSKTYIQNRLSGEMSWTIKDCYKILKLFRRPTEELLEWFPDTEEAK